MSTSDQATVDLEELYAKVSTVSVRAEAERLRLRAVELAVRYERLVDRGLDAEIVALDVAGVVRAWQSVPGARQ